MPVRSMTGYAQLTHQVNDRTSFSLSLKSVNHRFLDLHFRIPMEATALELKMRRVLKEKVARGHIEVALSLQHGDAGAFQLNHALVEGYVRAFQEAADRLGIVAQPDLNVILRTPGALSGDSTSLDEATEQVILEHLEALIERLNHMREEEGRGVERELRERASALGVAADCRFLGWLEHDELEALYAVSDAFVMPSLYEGFGLPVLEALACGATVVASRTTGVGEAAGDACVLVEPSDVLGERGVELGALGEAVRFGGIEAREVELAAGLDAETI